MLNAIPHESRSLHRRPVYLGEGLDFELLSGSTGLEAQAIDLTPQGLGLAIVGSIGYPVMPAIDDVVHLRYRGRGASGVAQSAVVRHVGSLRSGARILPRLGLSLPPATSRPAGFERRDGARYACPPARPAFATASCPWFFRESLSFQVLEVGAGGMTLRASQPSAPLLPSAELDFELHLAGTGVEQARGRLTAVRWNGAEQALEVGVAWIEPTRELLTALSHYLMTADQTLTPSSLRGGGLAVGSVERAVTCDYATTSSDYDEILALRLHAHQAEGHLEETSIDEMRSPFDAHSRHLTCRFGRRIVGYLRVIFVDRDPARSQYVSLGGHEVPQWLWDAGFVEGGAGATHPDFQRTGLYLALMQHLFRVAVQSGHRYVLGACPDELLDMYRQMGFELLEQRDVEPKPGWSFHSNLIYADAERLVRESSASKSVAAMASAVDFAGLRAAA